MSSQASNPPSLLPEIPGYTITEQLYVGSRTAVYRAVQNLYQRSVVIKILLRKYPSFSELVQFRNQFTIMQIMLNENASQSPSPSIVKPLSLEPLGNSYALVMEDFGGIALSDYIQNQSLDLTEVIKIALQITDILHNLSQHRIVHKDIKPANILIHPESQQVKLIDFSIASLLPRETQGIQSPNILEGTLAYLAPEQTGRMNRGIDYRADFYSLGVTLYQLLSNSLPFISDDPLELTHCHIAKIAVPVNQLNPEIPEIVAAIIGKLMAKNAEDRYQSALGLKHDLEQCLDQWQTTGEIESFELGRHDLSDRFLIPEKLYGRESEVQILLDTFDRVAEGSSELMLVAGASGIGKTAVINEVHKPITRQNGYFIKGKFDQFNRDIPLSAFVQALRSLMEQLFSESDKQLAQWRKDILAAVGKNGQVLINVIPELEQIIGEQPPASELSGSAAQNQFNVLFQKFIEVFTTAEHPLVLFLDDLQWADLASLQLIKLLMDDNGYLLVMGAYRNNEVSPAHPFILTVEELKKAGVIVNTLTLSPLAFIDTNHLIADTLNCSLKLAQPLAQLVNRKTQGNPFFTTQFLKALHEDGQIQFNHDQRYWQCDIAQVNTLALTDDVVEFMALQLQKLPPKTQVIMQLAACIGNQFDLATLAIVSEQSPPDAAVALWPALKEGLLVPTSQVYKFFQSAAGLPSGQQTANPAYRFLHDRIQQAAYSLIPEGDRTEIHYRIGRLLTTHLTEPSQKERIFEVVGHLNLGSSLITTQTEQLDLAQLNLAAGQKAISSTAYGAALAYLNQGIELLPENAWTHHYRFTLDLHHHRLDAAYLNTQFKDLEVWSELVLRQATSILDQIKVYETRMMALRAQGGFLEVIEMGLQVLRLLGIEFPSQPTPTDIGMAYEQLQQTLQGRDPLSLVDLPAMSDPQLLAAMQIVTKIVPSAFIAAPSLLPLLSFKQIELSVQHGNSPISIFSYADYGLILCGIMEDISTGCKFGSLSLALLEKLKATPFKSRVSFIVNSTIRHWQEPLKHITQDLLEGYRSGLESGDWECVGLNLLAYSYCQYFAGRNLSELAEEMQTYRKVIQQVKQDSTLIAHEAYLQAVLSLSGQINGTYCLRGEVFDIEHAIPRLQATNDKVGLLCTYLNQAILYYLFEQNEKALQMLPLLKHYRDAALGSFTMPILSFYHALIQLQSYSNTAPENQGQILEQVAAHQAKLQTWSSYEPCNHQHRWQLVAAETYRVLKQNAEAIEHYDWAIASAQAHGYVQDEAIANELAAKFYLDWNKEKIAAGYMQEAYYCYVRWGAQAKIDDLETRYPALLQPILQPAVQSLNMFETLATIASGRPLTITAPHRSTSVSKNSSRSSSTSINTALDFASILKASQSLAGTIHLEELLHQLTQIILQNSGGDRCILVLPNADHEWFVEAIATPETTELCSEPLNDYVNQPVKLIQYVKNTQELVVINNCKTDLPVIGDYLSQHQPKSVLGLPILSQGDLIGLLYLENRSTCEAFTSDRILILNFLCTQAAISLENARLYKQAQTYAQQLEQSQLQIVQSEKMASLGNLVAGVAHEINNPIGFISGSVNNAKEYVQDLLEYLALYQQHHPSTAIPVRDKAEEIDLEFLNEDLPRLLNSMKGATDRIKGISTSLRTFSRADTEYKVSANLHDGLDSTLLILKYRLKANSNRPEIKVIKEYGNLPPVLCFPGQLNQVFMNILANAIDVFDEMASTQSFAEITANPQKIIIRTEQVDDQVLIWIRDNGKGMTEAVRAKIFDHLFTTKGVGQGTGLGLAIARQIVVEKHGGSLNVKSALEQGSEFCICLPIEPRH